ncbi:homocysteine S-methyltransferase family protein [Henriciella aquimarina]|uniref:homocysteine S-methyltransferase family protein n=1 Tax=Henriciella aquimarina TaxID=545261 RepID=UPI000A02A114|nr:homocysteine S-methyltransferase family protein [Henriciella aquimarina]
MPRPIDCLPHHTSRIFLTDGGLEGDMMLAQRFEVSEPGFHTLLSTGEGERVLRAHFTAQLEHAAGLGAGFIIDTPTWRAQRALAGVQAISPSVLREANERAAAFASRLRDDHDCAWMPVFVNGVVGPCDTGCATEYWPSVFEAEAYHTEQIHWLAYAGVDLVTAMAFTNVPEAVGFVRASQRIRIPAVVSFAIGEDGRLPSGQTLEGAIDQVDAHTGAAPIYFMVNCLHPSHVADVLKTGAWSLRLGGVCCGGLRRRKGHGETCCEAQGLGAFAEDYKTLMARLPLANVFGGWRGAGGLPLHAFDFGVSGRC